MQAPPFLFEVLRDLLPRHLHNSSIFHRRRDLHLFIKVSMHCILDQLPQHPPQRLSRPSFGNHAFALDHAAKRGNGADLGTDKLLYFCEKLVRGDGGGRVVGCGESNEGKWEVAFQFVWDADDAAFGDGGVGGDSLFDRPYILSKPVR